MAVTTLQSNAIGLRPAPNSGPMATRQGRATTSQTWVRGAVLIRASGKISEASADPTADIIGVAADDVTSASANQLVRYYPAIAGNVFEATLEDQSAEDHALVVTNMFTDYGLQLDNNGIWYVDENETSSTSVIIVGVRSDSDITDATVRARVLVEFLRDVTVYDT